MIREIRQNFTEASASVGLILATALLFFEGCTAQNDLRVNATNKQIFSIVSLAIPIKCFVSHRPPSREGGSVGWAKKKRKNEHMIAY